MKKNLLLLVPVLLLLASCSRFQYATINSTDIKTNDKMEFTAENDSFRLVYNFNGENAPINITVQNKMNVPVYIDWQKSALIVEDKAISYVPSEVPIQGSFHGSTWSTNTSRGSSLGSSSGHIYARAEVPQQIAFLPPGSYVTKAPMGVTNRFIESVPDTAWHKIKLTDPYGITVPVKRAAFTQESSPLRFKSYLTVMIGAEQAKPVVFENSFYINELITANQPLDGVLLTQAYEGNRYYVKEATGFAAAATGFGVIAGVAAIAALSAQTNHGAGGSAQ
jgi:hypothetical protein